MRVLETIIATVMAFAIGGFLGYQMALPNPDTYATGEYLGFVYGREYQIIMAYPDSDTKTKACKFFFSTHEIQKDVKTWQGTDLEEYITALTTACKEGKVRHYEENSDSSARTGRKWAPVIRNN